MTQRTFVALLTVLMFAAGYAVRMATDTGQHVPPPPASLTREFAAPVPDQKKREVDRAKLVGEIEKYRQQIEAYRAQVDEIFSDFDREFALILTPAQKEKFLANQKRWAEQEAKRKAETSLLTDDDINRARDRPLTDVYWMVTVTPRLDQLTREYGLDATQQTNVRALLTLRRNKFIALLDTMPPPSVRLSRLAPIIQRVVAPTKAK